MKFQLHLKNTQSSISDFISSGFNNSVGIIPLFKDSVGLSHHNINIMSLLAIAHPGIAQGTGLNLILEIPKGQNFPLSKNFLGKKESIIF
ncbi:MAG: hypothetical protein KDK90_10700 [Leptospiraceae bacterium]|nr:hypothetical protein [Leptospiraceae bacterium]